MPKNPASNLWFLLSANILSHTGTGITMIAIPWLLVKKEHGETLYGYTTLAVMLLSIFFLPYIGSLVDRVSRKKLTLFIALGGGILSLAFAFFLEPQQAPSSQVLITLYAAGHIIYSLHFPTLFAWVQEIFAPDEYHKINGLMEVQGQVAMMMAGGLGSLFIEQVPFTNILLIDGASYFLGMILFAQINYTPKPKADQETEHLSSRQKIFRGFTYLTENIPLSLFLFLSFIPFCTVMAFNYVLPIHLSQSLKTSAEVFGIGEVFWAFGAVLAGLTIPRLSKKRSCQSAIIVSFFIFTVGMTALSINTWIPFFFCIALAMGWSNAGVRVARNTMIMEKIENHKIGRVNTALIALGQSLQFLMVLTFTLTISSIGTFYAFALLAIILGVSFVLLCWVHYKSRVVTEARSQGIYALENKRNKQ